MPGFGVRITPRPGGIARLLAPGGDGGVFLLRLGNRVLNNARRRVNVDTGYLRSTGTVEQTLTTTRVAFRAAYARAIHDGFRSYPGNPYLRDALNEEVGRL